MKTLANLLDDAKELHKLESDSALGRALGVKRQTVSNWRNGHNLPDAVACATLAGLTGEPLAKVLGIVGEARAISREEKAVWRKLAASALIVLLTFSGLHAEAKNKGFSANPESDVTSARGIMRSYRY